MKRRIGIGFIGHGWMGRVHAHAIAALNQLGAVPAGLRLVAVCGRDPQRSADAASRLGFERSTRDWRALVEDPEVDVVVNVALDDAHVAPSIAALERGKSVLCEKPLALTSEDARRMASAAAASAGSSACGFNYRFVPAIALAKRLVDDGAIGAPRHFRGAYLLDWANWASDAETAVDPSSGGIIAGLSHILDLMVLLAGKPVTVTGESVRFARTSESASNTFGPAPHHEDAYSAVFRLETGALASVSCSNQATGSQSRQTFEIEGTEGALRWGQQDLNVLRTFTRSDHERHMPGFHDVLVTDPDHPFLELWWPPGHILGWEHTFVHQWLRFIEAVLEGRPTGVGQAGFADGARAVAITEAIIAAARAGRRVELST